MNEDKEVEQSPLANFLVRCEVEDLDGNNSNEIMDIVRARGIQDAKDYVVGWLAIRGFTVKKWNAVANADKLRQLMRIFNR